MTTPFYAPPSALRGRRVVLPDDEARHAATVLRVAAGDTIAVVDGEGGWHRVRVDHAGGDQVVGTVEETRADVGEPPVHLTVGIGVVKSRDRFETFVEKAVEVGVSRIVPLCTERTQRESIRRDRLERLLVAAMKQCRRSRLPALAAPTALAQVLQDEPPPDLSLTCHEATNESRTVLEAVQAAGAVERVEVLVGPEGGFTEAEVEAARAAGSRPVSLGRRRLRAETAGIVAATTAVLAAKSARGG
jgi:16S rRNA (uracil1498-N3)-methyltransferase